MISVCLSTYNGEKFILEQIESILTQLTSSDELIISDDGSTDNSLSIIQSVHDNRIVLIHNSGPHGVNNNFENAIRHAKGDYIFLSDQDDVWLPNKVECCVDALKQVDLIVHDCKVVNAELGIIYPSYFHQFNSRKGYLKNIIRNTYIGACMAFRKEVLDYILPFPCKFPVYHDGWIASMVELMGNVEFLDVPCILYRRHDSNMSFSAVKSGIPYHKKLVNRILWFYLTYKRYLTIKFKTIIICQYLKVKPS